ncbi:MAG: T9SS type A sorting domain-containing protein [Ginsengibacter sp.]
MNGSGLDSDGTISSYKWVKISGPGAYNIFNVNAAVTNVSGLTEGTYQFELTVTDNIGATAKSSVLVTVSPAINILPVANAGSTRSITLPINSVQLSGIGTDADGTIVGYKWTYVSGPGSYYIVNDASAVTDVTGLAEGIYKFELTVTDNSGATAKSRVQVNVNPADNILPTANAGSAQQITLPLNFVKLSGTGIDTDGTIVSYNWAKTSGPSIYNIVDGTSAVTDATGLTEGIYYFELTVTDNKGAIGKSSVQVTVSHAINIPPTANAGNDQQITLPLNLVKLSGSGLDTDGTIVSYQWSKISGPSVYNILNAASAETDVTGLTEGVYEFELTVTDNNGSSAISIVQVTVLAAINIPPTVSAGSSQVITLPLKTVSLKGAATDIDGTIVKYQWTKISGPLGFNIVNALSAETGVIDLAEGIYNFELTVTDNKGATAKSSVQVFVNPAINIPPTANAGSNKSITLPLNTVSLKGTGTDTDGTIVSYKWTKISGPANYNIVVANSAETDVTGLIEGIYKFQLTVTDNNGSSAISNVQVTVNGIVNISPVASAGNDKSITLPIDNVLLKGTGTDSDGTIVSYHWAKISGPSSYNILNGGSAETEVTGLTEGFYNFELTITDDQGATAKSGVQVTVSPEINIPPVANAGGNKSITLPIDNVLLTGSGTDTDGTIVSYKWTKISGPASYNIVSETSAETDVTGLAEGIYQFELTVTDNKGATAKSNAQVIVNAVFNIPPTADAGSNKSITLPVNTVSFKGTGTDNDGAISSYQWTKKSGPSSYNIIDAASATTEVSGLIEGVYNYELTVTDNKGATATSSVEVIVNRALNVPPTANAGIDLDITLPINNVSLTGSGTDSDGIIVSYKWMKVSGPAGFTITNSDSANTDINDLVEGIYQFELKVTDDKNSTATSSVLVTVSPAVNIPPVANAGTNKTITLPVNTVTLTGSGTDVDGTIVSYHWMKTSGPASFIIINSDSSKVDISDLVEGVYEFELTVTDNAGADTSSTVQVIVNPANNIPPTANAGANKNITLPVNTVTLDGSGLDTDGTIVSYKWSKVSGPFWYTIHNSSSATTDVSGLIQGTYKFQLTVTDNKGSKASATVQVIVKAAVNVPPSVSAGTDQQITLPINAVTLSGVGADTDGSIVSYHWAKISGPSSYSIVNSSSASTDVTGLREGVYQFELIVTDNKGATGKSSVLVTVSPALNIPPIANAGSNTSITLPVNTVSLIGSGADNDGTIVAYQWTKVSGPSQFSIINPGSATTGINSLAAGTYEFELTVTDNDGAFAKSTVQVTVNEAINIPPAANAGSNVSIRLPVNTVSLAGTGTDTDGTIVSYNWKKISGPSKFTITNSDSSKANVTDLVEGIYEFELTVTDNKGANASATIQVTVTEAINISPTANAGIDKSITLPGNTVSLTGSGTDVDGTVVSYSWRKVSGPILFTIVNPGLPNTDINNLVEGIYQFELTVTDNKGSSSISTMQVIVNAAINIPPTSNAGSNKSITLPVNTVSLIGAGADTDGTITKYQWTKISGPSIFNFVNASAAMTDVSGLLEGIYNFELTVTDNKGATAKSSVQVTVNPAVNIPPTAYAGSNKNITLPVNTVSLTGTGTDTDGTIANYKWVKISGPSSYTIVNNTSATTDVSALSEGIYNFELTVTDNKGATAKSTVQVTVNQAINIPPTANAGNGKSITLPVNTVSLIGTGTDTDGTVASYKWIKISGPSSYNIVSNTSSTTQITALTEGIYNFELTVTDNRGATAKSSVQVTVNPAINIPPTANAGSNQSIILPVNTVSLTGTGTDTDGNVASYKWTKISGPSSYNIVKNTSAITDVTGLTEGIYQFELAVTDNKGAIAYSSVSVTVNAANNVPPTANAGSNNSVTLPNNSVSLAGSGADVDGTIASYKWTKISGPSGYTFVNASSAVTDVFGLTEGVYKFELTVTDNKGSTAKSSVQVTVNPANNILPTANAGSNKSITLPINTVSLAGSGSDADGAIASYKWIKLSGSSNFNIINAASAVTDVTGLTEGIYQFELTVTDNKGATAKSSVQVTVNPANNILPTANAGSNKSITLPINTISLAGSGSDADGTIISYKWAKISGPSNYNFVNAASAVTDVTGLTEGIYMFELTVSDNKGATAKSSVQVTVSAVINIAPTANAGSNKSITLPVNTISLTGSGSDADGTITSYKWTKISGPSGYNIVNAASAITDVFGLTEGIYQFELTVTDNQGATAKSIMQITVNAAVVSVGNKLPVANAGADITITIPTNNVKLLGSGKDEDGVIKSYGWRQISGPQSSNIVSPNEAVTDVNDLVGGTYEFELTVTDSVGGIGRDTAVVVVALGRLAAPPESNSFKVYPNPVVDIATVDVNTKEQNTDITMVVEDINGRTIIRKNFKSTQFNVKEKINLSNMGKGVYLVTIYYNKTDRQTMQIVKL